MFILTSFVDRRHSAHVFGEDVICEGESVTIDTHTDVFEMAKVRERERGGVRELIIHSVQIGCVCNNAHFRGDTFKGQPTETALLSLGRKVCRLLLLPFFPPPPCPLPLIDMCFTCS